MAKATGTEPDPNVNPDAPAENPDATPDPDAPAENPDAADPDAAEATPDEDNAVKMEDVAALQGSVVSTGNKPVRPEPFLSAGMADDLERNGWAIDPGSGAKFVKDKETGEIRVEEPKADKGSGN